MIVIILLSGNLHFKWPKTWNSPFKWRIEHLQEEIVDFKVKIKHLKLEINISKLKFTHFKATKYKYNNKLYNNISIRVNITSCVEGVKRFFYFILFYFFFGNPRGLCWRWGSVSVGRRAGKIYDLLRLFFGPQWPRVSIMKQVDLTAKFLWSM